MCICVCVCVSVCLRVCNIKKMYFNTDALSKMAHIQVNLFYMLITINCPYLN